MIDTGQNTFRVRQKNPKLFNRFSTKKLEDGVQAVIGYRSNGVSEVQSYIFSKDKFKSAKDAKLWVRRHNSGLKEHFSAPYINLKYGPVPFYPISEGYLDTMAPTLGLNITEGNAVPSYDNFTVHILESLECSANDVVRRAKVRLIESGESKNRNIYSEECLMEAAHLFEGVPVYLNHKDERNVEDKVGFYSEVVYSGRCIEAVVNIFKCEEKAWNMIQAQAKYPKAKICALSINAFGEGKVIHEEGTGVTKRVVTRLTDVVSTDMVDNPSAGGKILSIMESVVRRHKEGESHMENVEPTEETKLDEAFPPKKAAPKKAVPPEQPPTEKAPAPEAASAPEDKPMAKETDEEKPLPTEEAPTEETPEEDATETEEEVPVDPNAVAPTLPDPMALFQQKNDVMMAELHRLMMENEMLKKQLEALTMYESENKELKTKLANIELNENVSKKLKDVELPIASKKRLERVLKNIGIEVREGEKPSNWDLLIEEERSYVEELKESLKVTPTESSLGHARKETEPGKTVQKSPQNSTDSIRVAESITRGLGV